MTLKKKKNVPNVLVIKTLNDSNLQVLFIIYYFVNNHTLIYSSLLCLMMSSKQIKASKQRVCFSRVALVVDGCQQNS